jgi:hypothetical protein
MSERGSDAVTSSRDVPAEAQQAHLQEERENQRPVETAVDRIVTCE